MPRKERGGSQSGKESGWELCPLAEEGRNGSQVK